MRKSITSRWKRLPSTCDSMYVARQETSKDRSWNILQVNCYSKCIYNIFIASDVSPDMKSMAPISDICIMYIRI